MTNPLNKHRRQVLCSFKDSYVNYIFYSCCRHSHRSRTVKRFPLYEESKMFRLRQSCFFIFHFEKNIYCRLSCITWNHIGIIIARFDDCSYLSRLLRNHERRQTSSKVMSPRRLARARIPEIPLECVEGLGRGEYQEFGLLPCSFAEQWRVHDALKHIWSLGHKRLVIETNNVEQMEALLYLNCQQMELHAKSYVESLVLLDKAVNVFSENGVNHPIDSSDWE
ncbi:hypothetical protein V6N12_024819 [Hibiscus sabdariffa]|uniref:Uncharacterized protein n=1 Tax=Hibiscus sabdariffa TaxID=183260 RepID=A0ABR2B9F7_9ROSI